MKNLFLVFFTMFSISFGTNAQQVITSSSGAGNPRLGMFDNEVKLNFANLLALGSFEAGYERFLSDGHSIDFQVHINDRFGYNAEGNGRKFKTNSLQTGMNFYFGNGLNGRFHIYPFVKVRFGDFEEVVNRAIITTDMTANE